MLRKLYDYVAGGVARGEALPSADYLGSGRSKLRGADMPVEVVVLEGGGARARRGAVTIDVDALDIEAGPVKGEPGDKADGTRSEAPAAQQIVAPGEDAAEALASATEEASAGGAPQRRRGRPHMSASAAEAAAEAPDAAPPVDAPAASSGATASGEQPPRRRKAPKHLYLPLVTRRSCSWRSGTLPGSLRSLVGTYTVFACYVSNAMNQVGMSMDGERDASELLLNDAGALALCSGELRLKAGPEGLIGVMTGFFSKVVGVADAPSEGAELHVYGPTKGPATILQADVIMDESHDYGSDHDGEVQYNAELDVRAAGPDTVLQVLRVKGNYRHYPLSGDADEERLLNGVYDESHQELDGRNTAPLRLCAGDLRLDVSWRERGGHGDPGFGVAYLLRRTSGPPPLARLSRVDAARRPPPSWQKIKMRAVQDHF